MREKISKKAFFLDEGTVAKIDAMAQASTTRITAQQLVRFFVARGMQITEQQTEKQS